MKKDKAKHLAYKIRKYLDSMGAKYWKAGFW